MAVSTCAVSLPFLIIFITLYQREAFMNIKNQAVVIANSSELLHSSYFYYQSPYSLYWPIKVAMKKILIMRSNLDCIN
jgi:hypothetical protein